jgi:anti-sigma factor RsiW
MEQLDVHDWTAAYALDALSADETREYEEHLATCERCRAELAALGSTVGALSFAVESPEPPNALRERILDAAREERPNVVALRPRWARAVTAAAAVAAVLLVGVGVWAATLFRSLDRERSARVSAQQALAVLSDPNARRAALTGDAGTLVVASSGAAALVLPRLEPAPSGKTYEAWVIEGGKAKAAGTFDGGDRPGVVGLELPVPGGARVAVTVEDAPGGPVGHGPLLFQSANV